jgi:tubulin polyglutamylase TTLL4
VGNINKCNGNKNACFELYGFDILIDKNLKPWLLEVNVLPSLSSSSPFDKVIKTMLICDILSLIGIRGYDKKKVHSGDDDKR